MEVGLDRKAVKGRPGIHVHYYTSLSPAVHTIETHSLLTLKGIGEITAEEICIKVFTSPTVIFTEKLCTPVNAGSLHLFQLYQPDSHQWQAPNHVYEVSQSTSLEFVLRIRFKYPPSLGKHNFHEVWGDGAFYYYFAQCRHDFIHDVLRDVYHCHMKEDYSSGIALVDMARLAFEKDLPLKQLKAKFDYREFLPRHITKRTRSMFTRYKFNKSFDSALEETYGNFHNVNTNPLRSSIVSFLKSLLSSVPGYSNEEFNMSTMCTESGKSSGSPVPQQVIVQPYDEKQPGILITTGKGLQFIGEISKLVAISLNGPVVLLHFTESSSKCLNFENTEVAESFVSLVDGYYRLMYNYHYCLSDTVYSPLVRRWNDLKAYGPVSKDWLKIVWKRHGALMEGTFVMKQKSDSFNDFVIVVHKMGRTFPPVVVKYDEKTHKYSCGDLKALFQSHHREPEFVSVKELIKYYRTGDSNNFKLGAQLSPLPKEECPLLLCRDRTSHSKSQNGSVDTGLERLESPIIFSPDDINVGERLSESSLFFEILEATYHREPVSVIQIKERLAHRDVLTLCMQKDVQKCVSWKHDMIVRTFGVCLSPFLAVTQPITDKSLDYLLKRRRESVQLHHIIEATGQLAQALLYLETRGFTHGDIRAKNLMVSQFNSGGSLEIKLSCGMMTSYYASLPLTDKLNFARLPWLALERWTNLQNETSEADVFSFGVTVWEMCSRGERPLANCNTPDEVKRFLESGQEMPKPSAIVAVSPANNANCDSCSHEQYDSLINVLYRKIILENCSSDPGGRMKPQDIVKEITLLERQFAINKYDPVNNCVEEMRHFGQLRQNGAISSRSVESASSLASRPLPSVPNVEPHLIYQHEIMGLEGAEKLGAGFYGEVYLCKLKRRSDEETRDCAVKRLMHVDRDSEADERAIKEFERELKIMVNLEHKNIVQVYGECFYTFLGGTTSRLIVMEYVREGSMSMFIIKTCRHYVLPERLGLYATFASDIADGMSFLHKLNDGQGIIHRDLAARNVLITEPPHRAKITDFGLARRLGTKDYYRCDASSHLPVLWCAPESIGEYVFTKASDVWSYGVVLWEMYSNSGKPLIPAVKRSLQEDGKEVLNFTSLLEILMSSGPGTRLDKPKDTPQVMYNIMMKCWQSEASRRPTFDDIKHDLETITQPWV